MMMVTVNDCITLISFKMRESSLGTPVGNDDAVLSSFSVLPELLEIDPVISLHCSLISYCLSTLNLQTNQTNIRVHYLGSLLLQQCYDLPPTHLSVIFCFGILCTPRFLD